LIIKAQLEQAIAAAPVSIRAGQIRRACKPAIRALDSGLRRFGPADCDLFGVSFADEPGPAVCLNPDRSEHSLDGFARADVALGD
jgi:hypothetical protein